MRLSKELDPESIKCDDAWESFEDPKINQVAKSDVQLKSAKETESFFLAWKMRDLTVPIGMSISSAISS